MSIRTYLIALILSLFIPFTIFAGAIAERLVERERAASIDGLRSTARALAIAVDRNIADISNSLTVLATAELLRIGELEGFHRYATRVARSRGELRRLLLVDGRGTLLFDTNVPFDTTKAATVSSPTLSRALASGAPTIGRTLAGYGAFGPSSVLVFVPASVSGAVGYALIGVLDLSLIGDILADQKLPPEWTGVVIDSDGTIVSRSRDPELFVGQSAPPALAAALAGQAEGVVDYVTQEGWPTLAGFARSGLTGWTVVLGMPSTAANLAAGRILAVVLIVGTLVSLAALAVASFLGHRISQAVLGLLEPAMAIAGGTTIASAGDSAITEIQRVRGQLKAASDILAERETLRQRAEEQLRQTQKMEALGQLTGGIAHDFNNLLAVLVGNLELALRRQREGKSAIELDEASLRTAARGTALTRQLLAFARRQPLRPTRVDLRQLVKGMGPILEPALSGRISLVVDSPPEPCWVEIDSGQFEAALLNLALNARDAMPHGGVLMIGLRRVQTSPAEARVQVAVRDSGIGMSSEIRARAFEPFFTTKEMGKGSGLGLSMVYGFVRQSGGSIDIESEPGKGTTVTLSFRGVEPPSAQPVDRAPAAFRLDDLRVLLVEDDADLRDTLRMMLSGLGVSAIPAKDAAAAIELLKSGAAPDIILTDIAMPGGMDGIALAKAVSALSPRAKIVFMSANTALDERTRTALGGRQFLVKPFRSIDLATALCEARDGM